MPDRFTEEFEIDIDEEKETLYIYIYGEKFHSLYYELSFEYELYKLHSFLKHNKDFYIENESGKKCILYLEDEAVKNYIFNHFEDALGEHSTFVTKEEYTFHRERTLSLALQIKKKLGL